MAFEKDGGIFIVLGMHRSGTSMVAGLLHGDGICMGKAFRKVLPQNPLGFFEEESFRQLNDAFLLEAGYTVKEWSAEFSETALKTDTLHEAVNLIGQWNKSNGSWGWKDPRTCLTISLWLKVLQSKGLLRRTNIIVVNRSVSAVSKSLVARGDVNNISHGEALYAMYHENLEKGILEYCERLRILRIDYEQLLDGPDFDRLQEFCGLEMDRAFIDRSLDHSSDGKRQ
jgi:hypothetical protein